jgi:hypothetical protein
LAAISGLMGNAVGGALGNSAADVVASGQAGRNAVENNYLFAPEIDQKVVAEKKCAKGDATACKVAADLRAKDAERDLALMKACSGAGQDSQACADLRKDAEKAQDSLSKGYIYTVNPKYWFDKDKRLAHNLEYSEIDALLKTLDGWTPEQIAHQASVTKDLQKEAILIALGGGVMVRGAATALKGGISVGRMVVGAGAGMAGNGGIQLYLMNEYGSSFDPWSFALSGVSGGLGGNTNSFLPILMLNTGAAMTGSVLNGQDTTDAVIGAFLGSGFGYGFGYTLGAGAKGVTNSLPIRKQIWSASNWDTGPFGIQSYSNFWERIPGNLEVGFGTLGTELSSGAIQNLPTKK